MVSDVMYFFHWGSIFGRTDEIDVTYQGVPNPSVLCWLAILAKFVIRYRPAMIMKIAQQTSVVSGQR